jgi:uncharacterized protein
MNRRTFLSTPAFAALAGGEIPKRTLGRTGEKLTIVGMGGARFHLIPFEDGTALVRRAYELGINYFDMARSYWNGRAEEVYGAAIPPFRKKIFLTSKSGVRTRQGAEAELETSLRLMKTDYLDLWQMHGINTKDDVQKSLAPGGALEAFVAAKKAGKVRFIGFTGHADPAFNLEMLRSYDGFDTMLMPLHVADTVYLSFEKNALPASVERGIGQFGMKIFGNAFLLRTFSVRDCLGYTLSLPVTAVTLGFTSPGQLDDDVRIAQNFKPFTPEQMDALRARAHTDRFDVIKGPALEYWKRPL